MKSLLDLLDLPTGAALLYIGKRFMCVEDGKTVVETYPDFEIVRDLIIFDEDKNSVQIKLSGSKYDAHIYTEPIAAVMPFCDKLYLYTAYHYADAKSEYAFKIDDSKYLIGFDVFEAIEDLADLFREYGVEVL